MAEEVKNAFVDEKQPAGFSWEKFKITLEGSTANVTAPVLLTWTKQISEPEEDDEGKKKWVVGIAIPKSAKKLVDALRKMEADLTKTAGVKGPFPSFLRDGDAKDASGMFAKSKGKLQGFYYATAKSRRAPRVLERGADGAFLEFDPKAVNAGGYGMISASIIVVGYGSDSKKGTSMWMDKILWLGGGNQISGGGGQSDEDAFDLGDNGSSGGGGAAASFI